MKIPVAGPVLEASFYAQFSQTLANLLGNGVTLLQAMNLVSRATPNTFYRARLEKASAQVSEGFSLSRALRQVGGFSDTFLDLVAVGEQTGDLAKALEKAGMRYEKEMDRRIQRITALTSSPAFSTPCPECEKAFNKLFPPFGWLFTREVSKVASSRREPGPVLPSWRGERRKDFMAAAGCSRLVGHGCLDARAEPPARGCLRGGLGRGGPVFVPDVVRPGADGIRREHDRMEGGHPPPCRAIPACGHASF
ncbi:MAG: hypothetical protein EBZ83_07045 [Verrucomicrobia bacterium]|nr:hypothetical protein [Verrucomicrobiota bacterium]